MKKLFAQVLISLLALGCMACTACTTTEQPPAPPPKPALPYKINLVWQHDHKPEVDLSTLDKVPGVNVVSPCWYEIENEYGKTGPCQGLPGVAVNHQRFQAGSYQKAVR